MSITNAIEVKNLNMDENRLLYPISMNYGKKDWNVISALRELLSNMLDTQAAYNFHYDLNTKEAFICDAGKGLSRKDFIFGESTRDNSQIGQFGEGLKMALITLLRNNRKVTINTTGFSVFVEKFSSKEYESDVMLLTFNDNKIDKGTSVIVDCSQAEFDEAVKLFLDLREDIEQIDNNLYLPAGEVYIMGLKTTSIPNMLYSYNVKDKTMTNRDRNIVAVDKLQSNIIPILQHLSNQKAIRVFLENFETNPTAYEYQLPINPLNIEQWEKVLMKIYKDGKVCLSSDFQSDLNAYAMGYKVFKNIPYHVNNILKLLSIPMSNEVAKDYKDQGLFQKEKIIYPMSTDYCSNWTIKDALREFIANALDTGTNIRVEYKDGKGKIVDTGRGILKKHFIFGISEKGRDDIGQFGEGLKVASLVFARNGRNVEIQTIGCTYQAQVENNDEFDTNLFTVYFKKNLRKEGTVITFDCSEDELEESKQLFSYFRDGRKRSIYSENIDIFFDEPGEIYVNGLKTSTIDSIFGYNIKDKSLVVSRDRNNVDTIKLSNYIQDFMQTTTDESLIEEFLTAWKRNRYCVEYRTDFTPVDMSMWVKIGQKLFKKSCIQSEYEEESNFIAKQAGYEILKNMPSILVNLLAKCKISSAEAIAKKFKNKGIVFEDKVVYPVSSDYARNWTIQDAIRELIANALDTDTRVSINVKDGVALISDKGEGIAKRNLLFGNSDKKDDQIGQFGEGLKMASLVLARNNRDFHLVTKGYEYDAKIERDSEFQSDVLVLHLKKSKKRIGTDITFVCSEKEMNETKALFLEFNETFKKLDSRIYSPGGNIFVNGVFIEKANFLFSYDLINAKECLSRDRKSIVMDVVNKEIPIILGMCENEKAIYVFLQDTYHYQHYEHNLDIRISSSVKDVWRKVAKKIYPKHCIPVYTEYDMAAQDKGYTLLGNISESQKSVLLQLGFQYSSAVATLRGDEGVVKKRCEVKDLTQTGKERWKLAIKKFKKLYGEEIAKKCEIAVKFNENEVGEGTVGYYCDKNDTVYILKDLIENKHTPFKELMGTFIHEHVHRLSGAPDRTREFENSLSDMLGRLAEEFV